MENRLPTMSYPNLRSNKHDLDLKNALISVTYDLNNKSRIEFIVNLGGAEGRQAVVQQSSHVARDLIEGTSRIAKSWQLKQPSSNFGCKVTLFAVISNSSTSAAG